MSEAPETAGPTWNELLDLVTRLEGAGYADVDLEMPGLHLRMSTSAPVVPAPAPVAPEPAPVAPPAQAAPPGTSTPAPAPVPEITTAAPATGTRAVTAPMLGAFYRRPAPDQDPFVALGDHVEPDTSVGIIEVMKLMNPVAAGASGRVVEICADDGEIVEFDQVLFRIEPDTEPDGAAS